MNTKTMTMMKVAIMTTKTARNTLGTRMLMSVAACAATVGGWIAFSSAETAPATSNTVPAQIVSAPPTTMHIELPPIPTLVASMPPPQLVMNPVQAPRPSDTRAVIVQQPAPVVEQPQIVPPAPLRVVTAPQPVTNTASSR